MAGYNDEKKVLRCSFCNKTQDQVRKLIAGPKGKNVYICDECIDICSEIIEEEFEQYAENDGEINLRKPKAVSYTHLVCCDHGCGCFGQILYGRVEL